MKFKKSVVLLLTCSLLFVSQVAMIEALEQSTLSLSSSFEKKTSLPVIHLEEQYITPLGVNPDPIMD